MQLRLAIASASAVVGFASVAQADMVGWTASVRTATEGGFFVDVFAVTAQGDSLLNVYGGSPNAPSNIYVGYVATTASGGFRQSPNPDLAAWRPGSNQGWNSYDSFLTVGGGFSTTTGAWLGNSATVGDPGWNVGETNTFSTAGSGNANNVPLGAGWFLAGSASPARALVGLNRVASSSAEAASGGFGMLVAHLYIADPQPSMVIWNMGASVRRADGSTMQASSAFNFQVIPAPGAIALAAGARAARGRRRDNHGRDVRVSPTTP
jgi:hypothetical protein